MNQTSLGDTENVDKAGCRGARRDRVPVRAVITSEAGLADRPDVTFAGPVQPLERSRRERRLGTKHAAAAGARERDRTCAVDGVPPSLPLLIARSSIVVAIGSHWRVCGLQT